MALEIVAIAILGIVGASWLVVAMKKCDRP